MRFRIALIVCLLAFFTSNAAAQVLYNGAAGTTPESQGWLGYFGFCQTPWVLRHLEGWLRRRLRAVVWKQWKRGKVRFAELSKRGVRKELAALTAGSAHGPWRLSNSLALNTALPNAYFASLGLTPLVVN